jgi:regulator of replication initiation timing
MNIIWKGSPNFDKNRALIDRIILHWFGIGTLESANTRFQNSANQVSAHYGISNETVWQWVKEEDVAYHAGNYAMNQRSIGIEHDATTTKNASESTYITSSQLVAEICKRHNIPCDRTHILKHSQVVTTSCCGTLDIDKIISRANVILGQPSDLDKILAELSATKSQLNLLQVKYNELQEKYTLDMAEKQHHIESIQASSAEMTAQLQIGTETIKGLSEQIEGLKIDSSVLKDQLADFMEGNDTLQEQLSKLAENYQKKDLEVSELKAKLKEGLKAYTKFQLFLELFRK